MTSESVHTQPDASEHGFNADTWQALYAAFPEPVFICLANEQQLAGRIVTGNTAAQSLLQTSAATRHSAESDSQRQLGDVLVDAQGHAMTLQHGDTDQPAFVADSHNNRSAYLAGCHRVALDAVGFLIVTLQTAKTEQSAVDGVSARPGNREAFSDDRLVDQDYRHLLEKFQIPVTVLDADCRIILMNPAGASNLQLTPQDVIGKYFGEVLPEFGEQTLQRVTAVLESHKRLTFEDPVQLHDGVRWFRSVMQPMKGADGRRLVWTVSYDFTEERETQAALTETNERIRSLASNIPGAIFQLAQSTDGRLRIPYLGHALAQFLGPAESEARNDPRIITNIMHPEDRRSFRSSMMHSIRTRSDWRWEGRFLNDDDVRWVQAAARVRTSPEGEVLWDGVVMDVTDTHRLDESLQSQEQQFRTLVEACHDGILVHDGETFLFANPAAAEMFHANSPDQIAGRRIMDIVAEESVEVVQNRITRLLSSEEIPYTEATLKRLDGTTMTVEATGAPVTYRGRNCAQVLMRDITERSEWARTIRQSEERFRTLFNQAPIGIALIDANGCARMSNAALQQFFDYTEEQFRQLPVHQLLVRDDQKSLTDNWQDLLAELPNGAATEQQFSCPDGRQVWGRLTITALPDFDFDSAASLLMLQDISDSKQAEERSRHLQKMEAIGHLTGGVAHDFNNLLAVISGNLELLISELKNTPLADLARNAATAADRGARLTRQLLVFGRRAALRPGIIDLNKTISEWQHLLHRTIPASISIEIDLHPQSLHANVDQAELENALLNLALNARDAMPDGGSLTIRTRLVCEDELPDEMELQPTDHIAIQFRDTGCGMEDSVQDRAFDPFFTTKSAGAGTGLGLSMVYGFIKQSGGHVVICSEPQEGTTVELLLPCAQLPTDDDSDDSSSQSRFPGGGAGETILVVEDNDNVRDVILRQLTMLGYETVHAICGSAALEIIQGDEHLDVLLTDMVMPGELQGQQLVKEAQQARPDMPVLLMSGYADQVAAGSVEGAAGRLAKPFSIHDLAAALRNALHPSGE